MQIGKQVKKIRISRNLKQSAIAAALGMSVTAYSDIERGKTNNITLQRLIQISDVLKVPLEEIISDDCNNSLVQSRINELKLEIENKEIELKNLRGGVNENELIITM